MVLLIWLLVWGVPAGQLANKFVSSWLGGAGCKDCGARQVWTFAWLKQTYRILSANRVSRCRGKWAAVNGRLAAAFGAEKERVPGCTCSSLWWASEVFEWLRVNVRTGGSVHCHCVYHWLSITFLHDWLSLFCSLIGWQFERITSKQVISPLSKQFYPAFLRLSDNSLL